MKASRKKISVIGDGGWGTTLAVILAKNGHDVTLWGAFKRNVEQVRRNRINQKFLPGIKLPDRIAVTDDLDAAFGESESLILAVPSQYLRDVIRRFPSKNLDGRMVVSVIKGIDTVDLLTASQILQKELKDFKLAVLSGPTIAKEVAEGKPSTAVAASRQPKTAAAAQSLFHCRTFRIYTNTDVLGVELGGSLKNVIALACGVCDGLEYGTNTKAAILTRGLVEMARLGKAMGARSETFSGLSGLGDLVTTCMNPQSRNRSVGERLGKGEKIDRILSSMNMVAEGVETVKAVVKLGRKYKVPLPISEEVYRIIYKDKKPLAAVTDLMTRDRKPE